MQHLLYLVNSTPISVKGAIDWVTIASKMNMSVVHCQNAYETYFAPLRVRENSLRKRPFTKAEVKVLTYLFVIM